MNATIYMTDQTGNRLSRLGCYPMEKNVPDIIEAQNHPGDIEANLITIHPDVEYQTYGGMGGAFTDAAAHAWLAMPQDKQDELIRAYFDRENGIGYTFGRLSIASCDFSTEDYTYVEEGDETLDSFDISHDKLAVFPMVKAAMTYTDLTLFASPWSPPAYMKTSGNRIGGHLKPECYPLWAKYFQKYITACRENGIRIWGVTIQNEPRHHQIWESCLYSEQEEAEFLGHLGRVLEGSGVKILCFDHCRERIMQRANAIIGSENGKYCDGIANHWYSGDHFGELRAFYHKYPDKLSVASEGCRAIIGEGIQPERDLEFAESYAHDIAGTFNNGLHYYCDWNLTLNEKNGPYHNREGRGCSAEAPVYCVAATGEIVYRLSYYYIGHFSKFAEPGARIIATSSYTTAVEPLCFKNPEGSLVTVLLNRTGNPQKPILRCGDSLQRITLPPHSIATVIMAKA